MDHEKPVLVTTAHGGVFFGFAADTSGDTIYLKGCQNCLSWPESNKGFLGLAYYGPLKGSNVGPPANATLRNITCVAEVTPDAVKKWLGMPWKK